MGLKYMDGFRDPAAAAMLLKRIEAAVARTGPATLMEVCGTHTVALFRSGLRARLRGLARLLSGPGCPVCVTPVGIMDKAIAYSQQDNTAVAVFGDMVRVPGSRGSLERARAAGGDVRVVYSPSDALAIARGNPALRVVAVGVGFETTAPAFAATVLQAHALGLDNFAMLCAHKLVPPALHVLAALPELGIQGFICPGHASVIIGSAAYEPIAREHGMPCVITGFEPTDMLQGILMLIEQVRDGRADVENQYTRVVKPNGNPRAREAMSRVFDVADTEWRGLGTLAQSGLCLNKEYGQFDAEARWPVDTPPPVEPAGCRCADVITARIDPGDCPLFATACTPDAPVGACMVSSEGTCAAHFRYGDRAR